MIRSLIVIGLTLFITSICRAQESTAVDRAKAYEPLIIEAAIKHHVDPAIKIDNCPTTEADISREKGLPER